LASIAVLDQGVEVDPVVLLVVVVVSDLVSVFVSDFVSLPDDELVEPAPSDRELLVLEPPEPLLEP
jgi:hypothetical protein